MTCTASSPRQIIPPIESQHLPDYGSAGRETTKPPFAEHRNTIPSTQNPDLARSPIDTNQRPIDHPTLKLTFDIEKTAGAALKSP
jgi:hypothetical protein